jgi:hypothetical protein
MSETVTINTALRLQREYLCAGCWGNLTFAMREYNKCQMHCEKCGEVDQFVSAHYVNERKMQDKFDAIDAKKNLAKVLGIVTEVKTEDELVKGLGF